MVKNPKNTKPFYINISGRAGSGKTYFVNCISVYAHTHGGYNFLLKAAPTGNAAFLIGGATLHAMFKLPLQSSTNKELPDLSQETVEELQGIFQNCKLLVIDEKSMVGLYMLYAIDKRLKEIKSTNSNIPFGGISVILMGDFAQLPPVRGKPLFTTDIKNLSHYQVLGKMIFDNFKITIIFDQIMRQQGDDQKQFRTVLDNLASSELTYPNWEYLRQRTLMGDGQISDSERNDFLKNATMLCGKNRDLIEYNLLRIKALGTPYAIIKSNNSHADVANIMASKAQGLPSQVVLAKDCKVILTVNLWKEAGLTNGAKGVVKYIVYEANTKPKALPTMVIVEFPQYIGPSYLQERHLMTKCVPILPMRRVWYSGKKIVGELCFH